MRILFVASRFPYPLIQGDRVRAYHQLRLLSTRHQITLVTPVETARDNESMGAIRHFCEHVELIPSSKLRRLLRLRTGFFTSLPWQTLYFYDSRVCDRIDTLLRTRSYDLVHVQLVRMAPVGQHLRGIPKVLDFIDALSLNWRNRSSREIAPLSWLTAWEAKRLRRYEQVLLQLYDRAVICSAADAAVIGSYPNLDVVPLGVDVDAFPYREDGHEEAEIVFTGRMSYFPNVDAAVWFATEVFPLVRSRVAAARFLIAGADVPGKVADLGQFSGVDILGFVPRLHDLLARASVSVCPMRSGSGMQFKVLEAMASGAPVVATPRALGGIDAVDGEHVLVGSDPHALAAGVIRLLESPHLRTRLARNARRLIEANYTWDRSVEQLEAVYRLAILHNKPLVGSSREKRNVPG